MVSWVTSASWMWKAVILEEQSLSEMTPEFPRMLCRVIQLDSFSRIQPIIYYNITQKPKPSGYSSSVSMEPTYTSLIAFIVLCHNSLFWLTLLAWILIKSWDLFLVLHCHGFSKWVVRIRPKKQITVCLTLPHYICSIPATVFLTGLARTLLGGFEGWFSWPTLQLYLLPHLRKAHWPLPFGTGSSRRGYYSKDTGTAGKNCCSRWSPQPNQTCSPSALCWWWKGFPGWASGPLKNKQNRPLWNKRLQEDHDPFTFWWAIAPKGWTE